MNILSSSSSSSRSSSSRSRSRCRSSRSSSSRRSSSSSRRPSSSSSVLVVVVVSNGRATSAPFLPKIVNSETQAFRRGEITYLAPAPHQWAPSIKRRIGGGGGSDVFSECGGTGTSIMSIACHTLQKGRLCSVQCR